jgi:hypothetical protein
MSVPLPVPKWDVDTVCGFLTQIGLGALTDAFKTNAVNGSDLISLSDEDFKDSLGCTPLQVSLIICIACFEMHEIFGDTTKRANLFEQKTMSME